MLLFLSLLFLCTSYSSAGEISAELSIEGRFFNESPKYSDQEKEDFTFIFKPEYTHSWNEDRDVVTVIPYFRNNTVDPEKNLIDLRELSYVGVKEKLEWRVGVSKVFWGVVESRHLVDVINQVDLVANLDLETRLGQLMINPTYFSSIGNFSYFLLPHFRERTFPGESGRLRFEIPIDNEAAEFSSNDKEKHIDHALRWSHYYGDLEWAISYFKGTDREPQFKLNSSFDRLIPFYVQTEQVGIELQYLKGSTLYKGEILQKDSEFVPFYTSGIIGFEHTISNIYGGKDIGFLYEYIYDDRFENSSFGFYNLSFMGIRFAFNDADSTEILAGGFISNHSSKVASIRLEGSKRLKNNMKLTLEFNSVEQPDEKSLLYQVKQDDYLQCKISYYF